MRRPNAANNLGNLLADLGDGPGAILAGARRRDGHGPFRKYVSDDGKPRHGVVPIATNQYICRQQ
jgi:hypothetical protein